MEKKQVIKENLRTLQKQNTICDMTNTSDFCIESEMKMADALMANERLLLVIERFDIPLGIGDKTINDICRKHQVDASLLLLVMNMFNDSSFCPTGMLNESLLPGLIKYLKNGHRYYIHEKLPFIKDLINKFIENTDNKNTVLLRDFFNEYANEVKEHMEYEDKTVFPYIEALYADFRQKGTEKKDYQYSINEFVDHHSDIEEKPDELKNLLIKHFPPTKDHFYRNQILFELFDLEYDLNDHSQLEEQILVPLVRRLEKKNRPE